MKKRKFGTIVQIGDILVSEDVVTEENLRAAFGVPVVMRRFEAFGRERTAVAADYEPAEAAKE